MEKQRSRARHPVVVLTGNFARFASFVCLMDFAKHSAKRLDSPPEENLSIRRVDRQFRRDRNCNVGDGSEKANEVLSKSRGTGRTVKFRNESVDVIGANMCRPVAMHMRNSTTERILLIGSRRKSRRR